MQNRSRSQLLKISSFKSLPTTQKNLESIMQFFPIKSYGTTDTTRTFHLKTPSKTEIDHFTLVLKGFIASATTILSTLHSLNYLEGASRRFLSQKHLDFRHGLGHGVGSFSCVHEFPPSTGYMGDDYELRKVQPGLVFSNGN